MENRWINTKKFKLEFGIAIQTQNKLRRDKTLPYSKIGGSIYYDRILIDKLFENHSTTVTGD